MKIDNNSKIAEPFLRWAGGKKWLVKTLLKYVPKDDYTYYEPFLGSGAFFFAIQPKSAILGDINIKLIETYTAIRDSPRTVIKYLSLWKNCEKDYYKIRQAKFSNRFRRAAQFIFLNKTCWNGLYRVNQEGVFNVPFGYNTNRKVYDESNLIKVSHVLNSATLMSCDFQELVQSATIGDLVYLDPPYTVPHTNNGFSRYNERLFTWDDQLRLSETAKELIDRGCRVIISNAKHPTIEKLYRKFKLLYLTRTSVIAADPKFRGMTQEALFVSPKSSIC